LHSRIIISRGFLVSGSEMFSVRAVINVVLDTTQFNVINFTGMRSYSQMWALLRHLIFYFDITAQFSVVT